jgi:hypothetical protein
VHSPLLGFNNNVKHRGRLFHIQTEDSGVRHPHVITHLFMDGGRILKTFKTSYAEHVGSARLGDLVRELMKQQHKKMFLALREGQFDEVFGTEDRDGPVSGPRSTPVGSFEPMPVRSNSAPRLPVSKAVPASKRAPLETPAASPAAKEAVSPSAPPNSGALSATRGQRREAPDAFSSQGSESPDPDGAASKKEPRDKSASPRNAASRPAAIFTTGRAPEAGGSIFGDDLISEKSLDEVILSYLSEDLDTTSPNKK